MASRHFHIHLQKDDTQFAETFLSSRSGNIVNFAKLRHEFFKLMNNQIQVTTNEIAAFPVYGKQTFTIFSFLILTISFNFLLLVYLINPVGKIPRQLLIWSTLIMCWGVYLSSAILQLASDEQAARICYVRLFVIF